MKIRLRLDTLLVLEDNSEVRYNPAFWPEDEKQVVLPVSSCIYVDGQIIDNRIGVAREAKIEEIKTAFGNEFVSGHFLSEALQIEVDYRRCKSDYGDDKNDLQNVEGLITYMIEEGIPTVIYKGYEAQKAPATLEQVQTLKKEMVAHGIFLHEKKDTLLAQIKTASFEQLENIKW